MIEYFSRSRDKMHKKQPWKNNYLKSRLWNEGIEKHSLFWSMSTELINTKNNNNKKSLKRKVKNVNRIKISWGAFTML